MHRQVRASSFPLLSQLVRSAYGKRSWAHDSACARLHFARSGSMMASVATIKGVWIPCDEDEHHAGDQSEGWCGKDHQRGDRKSTRLNSSHRCISYAVFCLKKKITRETKGYENSRFVREINANDTRV